MHEAHIEILADRLVFDQPSDLVCGILMAR